MKILKKLTSNWGLKLGSLLFAMILWYLVTNINDPMKSQRFYNVQVMMKNTDIVTDAGNTYRVLDGTDIVSSITIAAPRSVAETVTKDNVYAIADFKNLTNNGTIPLEIGVKKATNDIDIVNKSSTELKLQIEKKVQKTLNLEAKTTGTLTDGYVVSSETLDQNQLRISGPESVISRIKTASVEVDITGFTSNIGTDVGIKLYDSDGIVVKDDTIDMSMSSVRVNVVISATKTVPVSFVTSGQPADGYMLTGTIECDPKTIMIAGKSSVLAGISSITITDALDVTGQVSDLQTTVDVAKYLPNGVTLGDNDFSGMCSVVAKIEPISIKNVTIDASNISFDNVPENYTVVLGNGTNSPSYNVALKGLADKLSNVSPNDLNAVADLSTIKDVLSHNKKLEDGTYTVRLKFTPPKGVTISGIVSVQVTVKSPEGASSSASTSDSSASSSASTEKSGTG
ncbi:CdaR family protein [Butyrivibrio sp. NC3005]|uniref:CdaR family protein n=1 Tax=Butyrivibrio sp. NC3005 TaxID=1280685 RepID=UPI00047B1CBA|nr:CdaR family protein [Butyrivibrio sp. NC3005]